MRRPLAHGSAWLLAVAWLTACTPPVSGLLHEKSFTAQSLVQGRLLVAGVASARGGVPAEARQRYADVMLWSLREARPQYPLVSAGELAHRLGDARFHSLLENYGRDGFLPPATLTSLREAALPGRYLALARIEQNRLERQRNESEEDVPPRDGEMVREVRATVDFVSTRLMAVSLTVYDLQNGQVVWQGRIEDGKDRHNTFSRTYDRERRVQQSLIELLLAVIFAGEQEGDAYPSPVPTTDLLQDILAVFARRLP